MGLPLMLLLGACSGARPLPTQPPPTPDAVQRLVGGSVVAVPRATPGVVRLSLWIDAGSRDAAPAQLATVAAWMAADRAEAQARVTPDGTEFWLECDRERDSLGACVRRLGSALRMRGVEPDELSAARQRLLTARRSAAAQPERAATQLALEALLGDAVGAAFAPLGEATGDAALTETKVQMFAAEHYGPSRSLLVGVGDVRRAELEEAYAVFRVGGKAERPRATRTLDADDGLRVRLGRRNLAALAVLAPGPDAAASVAYRLRRQYPAVKVQVHAARGATLLHVLAPGRAKKPERWLARLVEAVRTHATEPSRLDARPPEETLADLAREVGERWVAGVATPGDQDWSVGAALVLAEQPEPEKSENAHLAAVRKRAQDAIAELLPAGEQRLEGEVSASRVDATLPGGTRVLVERQEGSRWFAATLLMAPGAENDPPDAHGQTALLASVAADGCGDSLGTGLDAHLEQLQATLSPVVDADQWGLSIRAPRAHWRAAVDLLCRCMLRPSFHARSVEDARVRLAGALGTREALAKQALAGKLGLPQAPGTLAPWGSADALRKVRRKQLRRQHRSAQALRLVAMGAMPAQDVALLASRRLSPWRAGTPPKRGAPKPVLTPQLQGVRADVASPQTLVVWTSKAAPGSVAPAVVARALGEQLAGDAGTRVLWYGGGSRGASWAALQIASDGATVSELPQRLVRARKRIEPKLRTMLENALRRRRSSQASPAGRVRVLIEGPGDESLKQARKRAERLLDSRPRWRVTHPAKSAQN